MYKRYLLLECVRYLVMMALSQALIIVGYKRSIYVLLLLSCVNFHLWMNTK